MKPMTPDPSSSEPVRLPAVSVVVPVYNHAPYLRWRLDSILRQTYQDFEVILLDDCSTDSSLEVLKSYLPDSRLRLECNSANSGSPCKQWVKGLSLARGRYVWIAESDDWADLKFLERLVPLLEGHPGVGLAYCQSWIAGADNQILGDAKCWTDELDPQRWGADYFAPGKEEIRRFLTDRNTIPNASAVLLRRSVLDAIGPLDTDFRLCGDWLLWIRILAVSDIAFVADKLNFWRQHTSHARAASNGTLEWIEGERVLQAAARAAELSAGETREILFRYLRRCWQWQREYIEAHPPAPDSPTQPVKTFSARLRAGLRAFLNRR
jgi:cellulose synthase/poly-beta-1,6-N-acetylglucosamine synthase-like glycosyltransferase